MNQQTIDNVAKTLSVPSETLRDRASEVLEEQGSAWKNAGKTDEDCGLLAIRVAARMITTENARMRRAGATKFDGMFINSPRPKEWGKILYNKMSNQLKTASEEARNALINSGAVVVYENNHDGTYTRLSREDFYGNESAEVSDLPKHTMQLDENTHFYVVWDKNNATFPSGDANFKFGKPRPQDERERTSLFLTTDNTLITVKAQGTAADVQHPTFVTGSIPLREGKNNNAYAKVGVSDFTADPSLMDSFSNAPYTEDGTGLLQSDDLPIDVLSGLDAMREYYDTHNGQDGWWDKIIAVPTEVIHIDPRDNGGMVLVCADLDMTSTAPTVDVYISPNTEIDFAVGTKCLIVGQTWRSQEDEQRMSVGGWWAYDVIEAPALDTATQTTLDDEAGWDA